VVLSDSIRLFHIDRHSLPRHMHAITRLLFLPLPGDAHSVRSVLLTAEEVTLLCGADDWWDEHARAAGDAWTPIRVGESSGTPLDEIGVIASTTLPLAAAGIPLLYHSTFTSDFTMVPSDAVRAAVRAFETQAFTVGHAAVAGLEERAGEPGPAAAAAAGEGSGWPR